MNGGKLSAAAQNTKISNWKGFAQSGLIFIETFDITPLIRSDSPLIKRFCH